MIQITQITVSQDFKIILNLDEDFFKYMTRTQFELSDSIQLQIVKTLSRKDRKQNIIKIKKILKKYKEDNINAKFDPNDPEYAISEEVIHKISHFWGEYNESDMILDRSEAYIVSCIAALKHLVCDKIDGIEVR